MTTGALPLPAESLNTPLLRVTSVQLEESSRGISHVFCFPPLFASKNSQIAYLNQLVDQLQARHPKIEDAVQAAIKQQEAVMESRSQKVLSILRTKDIQIASK